MVVNAITAQEKQILTRGSFGRVCRAKSLVTATSALRRRSFSLSMETKGCWLAAWVAEAVRRDWSSCCCVSFTWSQAFSHSPRRWLMLLSTSPACSSVPVVVLGSPSPDIVLVTSLLTYYICTVHIIWLWNSKYNVKQFAELALRNFYQYFNLRLSVHLPLDLPGKLCNYFKALKMLTWKGDRWCIFLLKTWLIIWGQRSK